MENRVHWLDYGRFASALAVVCFHYLYYGPPGGGARYDLGWVSSVAQYGYMGVDFFFLVSGFVILYSAAGASADRFAASRAVRLYPAFLVCMTLTAAVRWCTGRPVPLSGYLANLTMVPIVFGREAVDTAYWSLAFELCFYLAVFMLLLAAVKNLEGYFRGWIVAQAVLLPWDVPFFSGYFSLFAGGALLAFVHARGVTRSRLAFLFLAVAVSCWNAAWRPVPGSPFVTVPLTVAFFAAFLVLRRVGPLPGAGRAGAVTYPLYLLHAEVGFAVKPFFSTTWEWFLVVTPAIVGLSYLVTRYVEFAPRQRWRALAEILVARPVRAAVAVFQTRSLRDCPADAAP